MKKSHFLLSLLVAFSHTICAQDNRIVGVNNAGSAGIAFPLGVFAESHLAGLSANFWHSRVILRNKTRADRKLWLVGNAGIEYYLGKKETVNGNSFRFGNYGYLHTTAGLAYDPLRRTTILLSAGPSLGLYKGNADLGLRVQSSIRYRVGDAIDLGLNAAYMKQGKDVNALWAVGPALFFYFD